MGSDSLVGQGDEHSAATAAATADLSRRLESVNASLDKSQRHLALAKEKEAVQAKELKLAREELAKKSNMLGKVNWDTYIFFTQLTRRIVVSTNNVVHSKFGHQLQGQ